MPDSNMKMARYWSMSMGRPPRRYHSHIRKRKFLKYDIAQIVDMFDATIVQNSVLEKTPPWEKRKRAEDIMKVILRWWSGCISGAKLIALETRDGPNTPAKRKRIARKIYNIAKKDAIFADGVSAAVEFKNNRDQEYRFHGISKSMFKKLRLSESSIGHKK